MMPDNSGVSLGSDEYRVVDDSARLTMLDQSNGLTDFEAVEKALRLDQVVLISGATPKDAESLLVRVAEKLALRDELELQSTFASIRGHRENVGPVFMTVNQRDDFEFVLSHSEGNRRMGLQLASFYCYENSTDGGVTVLQNIDDMSSEWDSVREVVSKIDLGNARLSPTDLAMLKMTSGIRVTEALDVLDDSDEIVKEEGSPFRGVKRYTVLARPQRTYSHILSQNVNTFWDSVSSPDFDSGLEYLRLMRCCGLFIEPNRDFDCSKLDQTYGRKVYRSGVKYESLFKARITRRLLPGELIIQNNLTWTHSATNWSPESGTRRVVAAFA